VNSTISGNSAGTSGGGIYCQGIAQYVHIMNSTISGNSAGTSGGGIYNFSCYNAYVANSTITGNSAGSGGGMYNNGPYGRIQISNTIINAGASGENIFNSGGTVPSLGYNLSSDDGGGYLNGPGDQINTDPLLGPLQDNGGPTFTHALLPGSPAIDAGDPSFTPPPLYDQRGLGFDRVVNGHLDIGSFEVQAPTPSPTPTSTPSVTPSVTPESASSPGSAAVKREAGRLTRQF
jgi:predicted outer membrane repeat protein